MDLTNEDVADILALLDSLPYDSLDVETPRFRLTLRRAAGGGWTEESQVLAEPALVTPAPNGSAASPLAAPNISEMSGRAGQSGTAAASGAGRAEASGFEGANRAGKSEAGGADRPAVGPARTGSPQPAASAAAGTEGLTVVSAPLPGTFYRAPRPGADPFVRVGDAVGADTVVAIVETMKLMNSVHAGTAGRVARICVDNGEFAPLGVTLMLIEPGA
jgi:acetyl-CoA carboxylase biotin carboxyl carrier protein